MASNSQPIFAKRITPAPKETSTVHGSGLPACKCYEGNGRNLVVCIDGTSNQFSMFLRNRPQRHTHRGLFKNTNVVELYNRLEKDDRQLTYYNSGIGTYAKPSWFSPTYGWQWTSKTFDLLFARRIDRIVRQAYRWLSEQYQSGDRIYLFGFSRGAYQIGLRDVTTTQVGLLHKGNLDQIPFAYRLYVTSGDRPGRITTLVRRLRAGAKAAISAVVTSAKSLPCVGSAPSRLAAAASPDVSEEEVLASFKGAFSHEKVRVHFVGVWDTVSSVGIFYNRTLPGTTTGMECACFFRHALALHERRVRFLPEYAHGGPGEVPPNNALGPPNRPDPASDATSSSKEPHIREVWFSGCHSDIGGGNVRNVDLQRFGPALRWMYFEAETARLRFKPPPATGWDLDTQIHDSMFCCWRIPEFIPLTHRSYRRPLNSNSERHQTWWRCHQGAPRVILKDHLVHASALLRKDVPLKATTTKGKGIDQLPVAAFTAEDPRSWDTVDWHDKASFVAGDRYTDAESVMRFLDGYKDETTLPKLKPDEAQSLKVLLSTEMGMNAMLEAARVLPTAKALETLNLLFNFYVAASAAADQQEAVTTFAAAAPGVFHTLASASHFLILPRLPFKELVAGLCTFLDEDMKSLQETFGTRPIPAAIGEADVPWIAYKQKQLSRFWAMHAPAGGDASVGELLTGTSTGLLQQWSVASDGTRGPEIQLENRAGGKLFSRVWRKADEKPVPTQDDWNLTCLAITRDGSSLITAWARKDREPPQLAFYNLAELPNDADATFDPCSPAVTGTTHTARISSIACSPHDSSFLTASWDHTVKLWRKNESGAIACETTFKGHADDVNHVVYSPVQGSHRIASGSDDNSIIVWDTKSGLRTREPFTGHTRPVSCVAFSPDGTRIVSGSKDQTVRLWETETGNEIALYLGHTHFVICVAFTEDGSRFASSDQDGNVFQWDEWSNETIKKHQALPAP